MTLALLRAPEAQIAGDGRGPGRHPRLRVVDVLPRLPDYMRCFALMAIPAVATTMAIIFLRTATNGVQSSLYIVYLNGVGLTGTSIGILFAAVEITSGLGSLFAGQVMRFGDPQRTMLSGTVLSILLICATPLTGGIFALLFVAQALPMIRATAACPSSFACNNSRTMLRPKIRACRETLCPPHGSQIEASLRGRHDHVAIEIELSQSYAHVAQPLHRREADIAFRSSDDDAGDEPICAPELQRYCGIAMPIGASLRARGGISRPSPEQSRQEVG